MRKYLRQIILFSIGLLLVIGIYIVDVIFYRVPNFIKVFRLEREIASIVALLLIFPLIRSLYVDYIKSLKARAFFFLSSIIVLFGLLFLPHFLFNKYIVLWDNNPMLAEFPVIWNFYSILCATTFSLVLLILIYIIRNMVLKESNHIIKLGFNLLILIEIIGAGLLNILEDRYLYQPVLDGYIGLFNQYKVGIVSFIILSAAISINGSWIDDLNKKDKIIYSIGGLAMVAILSILFSSKHIVAVYAFGTTLKGFILIGYLFILVFFIVSIIKLLFHLPTAAKMDRTAKELDYIAQIESKQKDEKYPAADTIESMLNMVIDITNADGAWLETPNRNGELEIINAINIEQKLLDDFDSFTLDDLKIELLHKKNICKIDNLMTHPTTKHFNLLGCSWKSMVAIPLMNKNSVSGVLYTVKNKSSGFDKNDQRSIQRLATFMENSVKKLKFKTQQGSIKVFHDSVNIYISDSENYHFDYLESKHDYNFCIFGFDNTVNSEKIAEIRGSLKILLQMNNPIEQLIEHLLGIIETSGITKTKCVFYFYNTKNNRLHVIKMNKLYLVTCDNVVPIEGDHETVEISPGSWSLFCFGAGTDEFDGIINDLRGINHPYSFEDLLGGIEDSNNCLLISPNPGN
jgi:uncharacterized membrane protein